jgi:hypothetical protein
MQSSQFLSASLRSIIRRSALALAILNELWRAARARLEERAHVRRLLRPLRSPSTGQRCSL